MPGFKRTRTVDTPIGAGAQEILRKKPFRKGSKSTARSAKVSKAKWASQKQIKNTVDRILARRIESKIEDYDQLGVPVYNATNNMINMYTNSCFGVSPNTAGIVVQQGTSQSTRIGNKIKTRKCTMRGCLYPLPYNATTNPTPSPQDVYLYIFRLRQDGDLVAAQASINGDFFQVGATDAGFAGSQLDWLRRVNVDQIICYERRLFKVGFGSYTGTGTSAVYQSDVNNDMQIANYFEIDLTPYVAKNVQFNDNTAMPTTFKTYAVFEAVTSGDRAASAADDYEVALDYSLIYEYEDA